MSDNTVEKYCEWVNTKSYDQLSVKDFYEAFEVDGKLNSGRLDEFHTYDHLITKTECFWWVASFIYTWNGVWNEKWQETFSRYDRLDSHLNKRLLWTNSAVDKSRGGGIDYLPPKSDRDKYADFLQRHKMDAPFTVYRGFRVRHGEAVREGVKKLDNPNAHIQVEGRGASFTLNPIIAISHLNAHLNPYFMEKYAGLTGKKNLLEYFYKLTGGDFADWQGETLTTNAYCCIGTYEVKKKDIVMLKIGTMEEVVFAPEDAKLVRYDFISWKRAYACLIARHVFLEGFLENDLEMPRSIDVDMEKVISIFEKYTGRVQKDPTKLTLLYSDDANPQGLKEYACQLSETVANNYLTNREMTDDGFDWQRVDDAISEILDD